MKKVFLLTTLLMAVMVSCIESEIESSTPTPMGENIPIQVSFVLNNPQTRSMHLPVNGEDKSQIETAVDSISLIAVIGTDDNSSLFKCSLENVGNGKYRAMLPSNIVANSDCRLYFIANAGLIKNFDNLTTLGGLRLAALPEAGTNGIDKYVMATKSIRCSVSNGSINIENIQLFSTIARLKFQYQNQSTPIEKVTISGTLKSGNLSGFLDSTLSSGSDSEELPFEDTDLDFDYANNNKGWGYYYVYPSQKPVNVTITLKNVPEPRTLNLGEIEKGRSYAVTVSHTNKVLIGYNDAVLNYDLDTNTFALPDGAVNEQITFEEGVTFGYTPVDWLTIESDANKATEARGSSKAATILTITSTANTSTSDRSQVITVTDIFGKTENLTITQLSSASIAFVRIPAGQFYMGSPESEPSRDEDEIQHLVTLSKSYEMSQYEITNIQYCSFLNDKKVLADGKLNGEVLISGSKELQFIKGEWKVETGKEKYPVVYVSWAGASTFADWAGGSLPTEAQWEYACRGDYANKASEKKTQPFSFGYSLEPSMCNFAWKYRYSASGEYISSDSNSNGTTPVGNYAKAANSYGLFDMHGNVWEWCSDFYDAKYGSSDAANPVTDPVGSVKGTERVLKGGSWYFFARTCRSAYRMRVEPGTVSGNIGFRIVR